jgi:NitT/TauT family transport system substrate-binding protein
VAIIVARGLPLREITPESYLSLFGTGVVTTRANINEKPEMVQSFVTALLKGHQFANDPANKAAVLADCAVLAPEEASEPALAAATFEQALGRTQPLGSRTFGLYDPAAWQDWLDAMLASGELQETQDASLAFTNTFVENATAALGG